MRSLMLSAALVASCASLPVVVGCDREVESERSVEVKDDGTKVTKESTVSETAEGGVKKEESRTVDKPDEPDTVKREETTVRDEDGTVKKEEKTVDR